LYGCGDSLTDYAVNEELRNDLGFLFTLTWDSGEKQFRALEMIPTKLKLFQLQYSRDVEEQMWQFDKMNRQCEELETVVDMDEGLENLEKQRYCRIVIQ